MMATPSVSKVPSSSSSAGTWPRIHREKIIAVFQTLFHQINTVEREVFTALAQRNMGGKRAGAWFIEQFHRSLLFT